MSTKVQLFFCKSKFKCGIKIPHKWEYFLFSKKTPICGVLQKILLPYFCAGKY
jgi:hypothetical protein